ncbi:MAG: hypothetical protein HZA48_08805 [Planctomycetes bacterium]|nr:hypothetical protein [Planctomycetota bacterium]
MTTIVKFEEIEAWKKYRILTILICNFTKSAEEVSKSTQGFINHLKNHNFGKRKRRKARLLTPDEKGKMKNEGRT